MASSKLVVIVSAAVLVGLGSTSVAAQTLTIEDWRRARDSNGCGLIPWSDTRSECTSRQSAMKEICERRDLECKPLGIPALADKRRQIVDELKSTKATGPADKVASVERSLSDLDATIKGAGKEATRRLELNKECKYRREAVMSVFSSQSQRVSGVYSGTNESDLKSVLSALKQRMDESIENHEKAPKGLRSVIEEIKICEEQLRSLP